MGINFGKILGGLTKAVDIGAKAGIPVAAQIDAVVDAVKDIKGKRKIDEENVTVIVENLKGIKTAIPQVKGAFDSNRFKATLIGLAVTVGAYYGLPEDVAVQLAEAVFYLLSAYVLGDTLRPSNK